MAEDTQRVVTNFADLLPAHRKIHRKLICCYEIILALLFLIQNSRSENYWKFSKISPGGREVVVNYLWPDAMMKPMILHETYTVNGTMLQYYPKDHVKMTALAVRSFVSPIRQTFDFDSSSSIKPQNYFHQSSYQYYQGGVNSPPPNKVAPGMDQKYQQRQQTQQQRQQQQAMTRPIG